MQAMNASVRNVVFAPVFFATPVVLLASALLAFSCRNRRAALCFTMAGLVCGFGGMALTMAINVPLNQALALIVTPLAPAQASAVGSAYSKTWKFWNIIRTCAAAVALLLTGLGLLKLTQTGRDSVNA